MVKRNLAEIEAEHAERMDVAVADLAEIAKIDAELEGRVGGPHHIGFVHAERFEEGAKVRQGRFANADDPDLLRFDEVHRSSLGQHPAERAGGHPSCRAAADDDHFHRSGADVIAPPPRPRPAPGTPRAGEGKRGVAIGAAQPVHGRNNPVVGKRIRQRIMAFGHDALADHHRQPARDIEQLVLVFEDSALVGEQVDLAPQRIGHRHRADLGPERVGTARRLVMEHDEVTHALISFGDYAIIFVALDITERHVREQLEQLLDAMLDEPDAGRFERLQKACGQADGDDIALPAPGPAAGLERQLLERADGRRVEVRDEDPFGLVIVHVGARIDVAVAGAVLEADAPLPAGTMRDCAGEWEQRFGARRGHGDGAVAWQPVAPVLERGPMVSPISRERKPEQSMNSSPSTIVPSSSLRARTWPVAPSRSTSTTRPSVRSTPRASAYWRSIAA